MPGPMPQLATSLVVTERDRLAQAEQAVRSHCGWHVAPVRTGDELEVTGSGSGSIFLPTLCLVEVESIVFAATDDEVEETVDLSLVTWTRAGVLTKVHRWWGYGRERTATITFTHGHNPVPADVTAVVIAVAQRAVTNPRSQLREQAGPFSGANSQVGFNQAPPLALLDAEKDLLRSYRIPRSR